MAESGSIVVATSIPPSLSRKSAGHEVGEAYQKLCVKSWIECGFRIISVNDGGEIESLAKTFPEVEFVRVDRNASSISGRKNPYVVDLLAALCDAPEPVLGIVNADIVFEPRPIWRQWLSRVDDKTLVTGHRFDTRSLVDGRLWLFHDGFDFFFFGKAIAGELADDAMPFAMGLPWWDYWLPLSRSLKGGHVLTLKRPSAIHLWHKSDGQMAGWRDLGLRLAAFAQARAHMTETTLSPTLARFFPLCRELAAFSDREALERGDVDGLLAEFCEMCLAIIRDNFVELDVGEEPLLPLPRTISSCAGFTEPLGPADVFRQFRERAGAGELTERAWYLEQHEREPNTESLYRGALEAAPTDVDVLIRYGEFLGRRGEAEKAMPLFRKALEVQPQSCAAWTALGMAMLSLGRRDEAAECLEKALTIEPDFAMAHHNLVLALYPDARHEAALRRFERVLASQTDPIEGRESYCRLKRRLRVLNGAERMPLDIYRSRNGEDALLDESFGFKPSGTFIDIGAGDGVHFSNSSVFEKCGWSGICIETRPALFELCAMNRPRSRCCREIASGIVHARSGTGKIDFVSISNQDHTSETVSNLDLEGQDPTLLVVNNGAEDARLLDADLSRRGYVFSRSLALSRIYARSEADARAIRALTVSAKLAHKPRPLRDHYVFWPTVFAAERTK
jgi:tetratricopeptide (TPR) repeat protein